MSTLPSSTHAEGSGISHNVLVGRIPTTAGTERPYIIPYLGAKSYTWITKDDAAKKEHEPDIRVANISVVWVTGLERPSNRPKRNYITVKDLHRMLTDKLDDIAQTIADSNRPQYFILSMRSDGKPRLGKTTLEQFFEEVA